MPIIKPSSDLRNHFNQISDLCHSEGQPVFITKNGKSDLVVMSNALYEKQMAQMELYQKINEAELEARTNDRRIAHKDMMKKLKARING